MRLTLQTFAFDERFGTESVDNVCMLAGEPQQFQFRCISSRGVKLWGVQLCGLYTFLSDTCAKAIV